MEGDSRFAIHDSRAAAAPPPRDPQLGGVTAAKAEAWARAHGRSVRDGLKVLNAALAVQMQRRADDPFAFGYEPPIWFVASALLEGSPVTAGMEARVRERTGLDWETFAERMRLACGFDRPVRELLIMGANRSGKTDWAAKRLVRRLTAGRNEQLVVGAQTRETSRSTQQDRVWHYLPKDLRARNGERGTVFYLTHKEQTGFTFNKITMDDKSNLRFVTYEQDVNAIMEGPAFDEGWLDEEFGKRWLDALRFRLSSKRGTLIATFTPVSGYTPVVADFLEGMVVTRRTTAYLLPADAALQIPYNLHFAETCWADKCIVTIRVYTGATTPTRVEDHPTVSVPLANTPVTSGATVATSGAAIEWRSGTPFLVVQLQNKLDHYYDSALRAEVYALDQDKTFQVEITLQRGKAGIFPITTIADSEEPTDFDVFSGYASYSMDTSIDPETT